MRVAKMTISGKERIVEIKKVGEVRFATGVWALVSDLDRDWHSRETRWVPIKDIQAEWIKEFS